MELVNREVNFGHEIQEFTKKMQKGEINYLEID